MTSEPSNSDTPGIDAWIAEEGEAAVVAAIRAARGKLPRAKRLNSDGMATSRRSSAAGIVTRRELRIILTDTVQPDLDRLTEDERRDLDVMLPGVG